MFYSTFSEQRVAISPEVRCFAQHGGIEHISETGKYMTSVYFVVLFNMLSYYSSEMRETLLTGSLSADERRRT